MIEGRSAASARPSHNAPNHCYLSAEVPWHNCCHERDFAKDALHLSVKKRIKLVCEIWDSIGAVPEAVGLRHEERALLDERMGALQEDPKAGSPWETVYKRIQARLRK